MNFYDTSGGYSSVEKTSNRALSEVEALNQYILQRSEEIRKEQENARARRKAPKRPMITKSQSTAYGDEELWSLLPSELRRRYRFLREIGAGAFGKVFLAEDILSRASGEALPSQSTDMPSDATNATASPPASVVIKVVRVRAGGEEPILLREGIVLSLLPGPPHTPLCIDYGVGSGACYFVVE